MQARKAPGKHSSIMHEMRTARILSRYAERVQSCVYLQSVFFWMEAPSERSKSRLHKTVHSK